MQPNRQLDFDDPTCQELAQLVGRLEQCLKASTPGWKKNNSNLAGLLKLHWRKFSEFRQVEKARLLRNRIVHRDGASVSEAGVKRALAVLPLAIGEILKDCPEKLREQFKVYLPNLPSQPDQTIDLPSLASALPRSAPSVPDINVTPPTAPTQEQAPTEGVAHQIGGSRMIDPDCDEEVNVFWNEEEVLNEDELIKSQVIVEASVCGGDGEWVFVRPSNRGIVGLVALAEFRRAAITPNVGDKIETLYKGLDRDGYHRFSYVRWKSAAKKKVRINELARELEVKAYEILGRLPELGVTEKITHSGRIDEDVAIKLRRIFGVGLP